MMVYRGYCYCGSMQFEVQGQLTRVLASHDLRAHRRSNFLWLIKRQQWQLCNFTNFCHDCGVYPYVYRCEQQSIGMLALDIRCLQASLPDDLKIIAVTERYPGQK